MKKPKINPKKQFEDKLADAVYECIQEGFEHTMTCALMTNGGRKKLDLYFVGIAETFASGCQYAIQECRSGKEAVSVDIYDLGTDVESSLGITQTIFDVEQSVLLHKDKADAFVKDLAKTLSQWGFEMVVRHDGRAVVNTTKKSNG